MAILNRLRNPWILFGAIGVAMVAFILTDQFNNIGSSNQARHVGVIDGDVVTTQEYSNRLNFRIESYRRTSGDNQLQRNSEHQMNQQLWDEMVREKLQGNEYDDLGVMVTDKELYNVIISFDGIKNDQNYINPNTGQFDDALFRRQLEDLMANETDDPEINFVKKKWVSDEEDTRDNRLNQKYYALIQKGLYVTQAEAKKAYFEQGQTISFSYIQKPYAVDSTIQVSEADLKAYYNAHKNEYKVSEPSRSFEYVLIDVEPSDADKQEILDELASLLDNRVEYNKALGKNDTILGLRNTEDDSLFVVENSETGFDPTYYPKDNLPKPVDSIFSNSPIGTVHGPYQFGSRAYAISKLTKIKAVPDSARARHILIAYQGAERANPAVTRTPEEAKIYADSIFALVKGSPEKFDELARSNSDGPSKDKGGDLEWFTPGAMATNFNDFVFEGSKGDLDLVETQFGFHIIEITDMSKSTTNQYQLSNVVRELRVGDETDQEKYIEARDLAESTSFDQFTTKAQAKGYQVRPVQDLKPFDELIRGLGKNRKMVKWAFKSDTEVGDFELFDLDEQYIIAHLSSKVDDEYKTLDQVKDEIEFKVRKEKQAEQFAKELADAKSAGNLQQVATTVGLEVKSQGSTLSDVNLTGIGAEPKVVGAAFGMAPGQLSEPIEGKFGVYLVSVTASTQQTPKEDYTAEKSSLSSRNSSLINGVFEMLKEEYKVEDNRYQFY